MRSCVRRTRARARAALRAATRDCQEELAELGPADFAEEWGSDDTGSDAMAECISFSAQEGLLPEDPVDDEDDDLL